MALCELDQRGAWIWQMPKWYRPVDATPGEIWRITLKACRPLVIRLYANPQRQRKDEVMDYKREVLCARYHNLGDFAIAIVAVVNYHDGKLFDWTAYIGGCADVRKEQAAIAEAVLYGNKLSKEEAKFYFDLPIKAWRPWL